MESNSVSLATSDAYARVNPGIDNIGQQVHQNIGHTDQQHTGLQHGIVTTLDGFDGQQPYPGPAENGFCNNRPCQQGTELQAQQGDDGQQGIAQTVTQDDTMRSPLALAVRM